MAQKTVDIYDHVQKATREQLLTVISASKEIKERNLKKKTDAKLRELILIHGYEPEYRHLFELQNPQTKTDSMKFVFGEK